MKAAQLAQDLIKYLNVEHLPFIKDKWKCTESKMVLRRENSITRNDYFAKFKNSNSIFVNIKIWLTSGKKDAYNPPRWYITVIDSQNNKPIHHISLEQWLKENKYDENIVEIHESFIKLGISKKSPESIIQEFPCMKIIITSIDNRKPDWQAKALSEILDHGICRKLVKDGSKKPMH